MGLCALSLAAVLPACASTNAETQALGDRTYRIRCKAPLAACLKKAEELCPEVSYDVLKARDRRTYTGVEPAVIQHRSSEAIVECGSRGIPMFDEPDLAEEVQTSPEGKAKDEAKPTPTPEEPRLACTPGVSEACVGIGGCQGGQACREDGSGFGPCLCAPPSAAPAPSDEAPAEQGADRQGPETNGQPPAAVAPAPPTTK